MISSPASLLVSQRITAVLVASRLANDDDSSLEICDAFSSVVNS
jgi:hypothetical protein